MRKKSVKVYYYKYPNIGDILNALIFQQLFHLDASIDDYGTADMMAIGSIVDRLLSNFRENDPKVNPNKVINQTTPIKIWGSGMIKNYKESLTLIRPIEIYALRGKKTKKLLEKTLNCKISCVLADPGLLAPLLLKHLPEKKYDVGIIPHYVDADLDVFKQMKERYPNSILIDVGKEPMEVLKMIASCKSIVSTSLHGLIIADSFGIPNLWCEASESIIGKGFKYRDYYSSYGLKITPFNLREGEIPNLNDIISDYQIKHTDVIRKQKQLLKCFPYKNYCVWRNYFKLWRQSN